LVTTRSKRWNGNFDSLPADYLKGVMEKMQDYGDRVQFSLMSGGPQPSYQLENAAGKKMAFDRNHHLLNPQDDEFVGVNASAVFTLDQIKAAIAGVRPGAAPAARAPRAAAGSGSTRTTAAQLNEQFAAQRYEYFRNHRTTLPTAISAHSDEITELMKNGKPVEEAFNEVVKKYF
jgi:hypothetical protein